MRHSVQNTASLGTILGIWAHPDDETWACAGVMSAAIGNGQRVACVMATRGDAGKTADPKKWPQKQLSSIRQAELTEALNIVGVHDLYWLDYEDGELAGADKKRAVHEVVELIDKICPDTILTFEPSGITGHQDHRTISAWTCAAVKLAKCQPIVYGACETKERYDKIGRTCDERFDIYFDTDSPKLVPERSVDLIYKLTSQQAQQKLEALRAHQSQTSQFFDDPLGREYLKQLCVFECFIRLN